jgi:hypothetical protein
MNRIVAFLQVFLLLLGAGCSDSRSSVSSAHRGFAGTWQLNRLKSDIPAVTKSQVVLIETDGVLLTMRETLVNDKGETLTISVDGKFDGRDYPVAGTSFADTVSYRLLKPNTIEGVSKKKGTMIVKETAVLSDDEKSVRVKYVTFDGQGHSSTSHAVFERIDHR